jgi:hypothetical protein
MIVEAQHLGDQPGAKLERQLLARRGGASSRLRDHVTLERGQAARRVRQPSVKKIVEFVPRYDGKSRSRRAERALQYSGSAARRHNDGDFAAVQGSGFWVLGWFWVLGSES